MARTKAKSPTGPPPTTAQALGSLIKSARDIMRKDKGLNGDLDRLPMLTWIMFLKFLDDLEIQREQEAKLAGKKFRPAIDAPYRWRDWAARADGVTGDEMLSFINNEECIRPDGKKGAGLFAYLRKLTSSNGDDRRDVIATVFRGVDNRMKSGYLLRDVITKVGSIHFTSSDELHTLGALYESMLREMRDVAGDSGEFYTPRPVVRFIVEVTDPRLGETVLDPACGTGGFLVEAFTHLSKQVRTVADRKVLQARSLLGCEAKPLPYLLGQMNLLLHGLDAPQIDPGNSLRFKLTEIGEKDRVDVVLTNPPFGGEEEKGIQANFPEDRQTAETALLFLQLIMRRLRRANRQGLPARAAVVVPNGTLFGDGVCARIKWDLLKEFNLHTVVRLPEGVFAPYTGIPTNILFFDHGGPTREIWYYEQPPREGVRRYSRAKPFLFEELRNCIEWWNRRTESERAWKVVADDVLQANCNLDRRNPYAGDLTVHEAPEVSVKALYATHAAAGDILRFLSAILNRAASGWHAHATPLVKIRDLLSYVSEPLELRDDEEYVTITVKRRNGGLEERDRTFGRDIKTKKQFRLVPGAFIISRVQCWHQAYAIVPETLPGNMIASGNYDQFVLSGAVEPRYLWWLSHTQFFAETVRRAAVGVVIEKMVFDRNAWLEERIPVPDESVQRTIVEALALVEEYRSVHRRQGTELDALILSVISAPLGQKG